MLHGNQNEVRELSNVDTSAALDFESTGLEFEKKGQYERALSYIKDLCNYMNNCKIKKH